MIDLGRFSVLGIPVDAVDYEAALDRILRAARDRRAYGVSALAVHGVMTGARDPAHAARLRALQLIVPDGQPVRWALSVLHRVRLPDRVYGPTLTIKACEAAARENLPVFLYGSTEAVLDGFSANLRARFPTLSVAGRMASRFRCLEEGEQRAIAEQIRESGARLVLVGLGCPRQEVWVYEHLSLLTMPMLAVGAAFDFHAGLLPQAPPWMQGCGLEWLFRLFQEPRRLWRRYLILNPLYLWGIGRQRLGLHPLLPPAGPIPPVRPG
jgi:N-acetylglucosaminyldiphosphoundecaprenol N-acetyl-beta-D-mannosaminyltransferase